MSPESIIHCRNVHLLRENRLVLASIDWQTYANEYWFILGNNGSGKTSLIEILLGYLWPQRGTVQVLGETFGRTYLPELRQRIGYLSSWIMDRIAQKQNVEDIVASGREASVGYYQPRTEAMERKIHAKLRDLDAAYLMGKSFKTLSCGQQYVVLLARALINDPALLILDEPFALLDMKTRYEMLALIGKLITQQHIRQIIFITHHLDEITPDYTHGLILKDGRIFQQGTRDAVLQPDVLSHAFDLDPTLIPNWPS
jgi:iron complex transport system ATP-binding protein